MRICGSPTASTSPLNKPLHTPNSLDRFPGRNKPDHMEAGNASIQTAEGGDPEYPLRPALLMLCWTPSDSSYSTTSHRLMHSALRPAS